MTHELPALESLSTQDALNRASSASRASTTMKNYSVRMTDEVKCMAQDICERHATDLGTYLRECAKALCEDYGHSVAEE